VFQEYRKLRFYDCCAAERRLRKLLQIALRLNWHCYQLICKVELN
jgi:hypothetical protein